jgi:Protein of unknown function (DUF3168)
MSIQSALDAAIYTALGGTHTNAGTAVFLQLAPDNYPLPYVVWSYVNEGDRNETPHRLKDVVLSIRAYASTAKAAKTIDAQIDGLLHHKTLTVTGWTNILTRRENGYALEETDSAGIKTWMRGADYRFLCDK